MWYNRSLIKYGWRTRSMKLRESQRCELTEKICRRWIRRCGIQMAAPKVYLIEHSNLPNYDGGDRNRWVWGSSHNENCYITLHMRASANKRDKYILLCHEFAHYLDFHTSKGIWQRHRRPHGERFQRLLWGLVPRGLWKRAAQGQWIVKNGSSHRPEFQPD